jgi:hypothetical protein
LLNKLGGKMADCEKTSGCLFFNDKLANMPSLAAMMKERYCKGDFSKCARYIVCTALGKEKVPEDLFPAMLERANQIIRQN